LFYIFLEHSTCVALDDFDECKNERSIRVQQLIYTVFTVLHRYCSKACDISLPVVLKLYMQLQKRSEIYSKTAKLWKSGAALKSLVKKVGKLKVAAKNGYNDVNANKVDRHFW